MITNFLQIVSNHLNDIFIYDLENSLETLDPRDCREQFLAEYELFVEQRKTFEEEMRRKDAELSRREQNHNDKVRDETERLRVYADRLSSLEEASIFLSEIFNPFATFDRKIKTD